MRIVDRYIGRELLAPFVLGIMIFTFVLLMSQILRLTEMIVNKGVGLGVTLKLVLALLPSLLVLTVPMSVFLSCTVTFGRLSAETELTAFKTGGYSLLRLSVPVAAFSLAAWGLTTWLIVSALPAGNQTFRQTMFDIVRSKASVGIREKLFNDEFEGLVIYVNRVPQGDSPVMEGIFITDYRPEKRQPPQDPITIVAQRGWLVSDPANARMVMRLEHGGIHILSKDRTTYERVEFRTHDLQLSLGEDAAEGANMPKGIREMNIGELRARMKEFRAQGGRPYFSPLVELHKKFSIPFATLIFGVLGVAMGVLFRRGEKLVSFAVSTGIAIVYYIFLLAGEPLGKQGTVHPFWAMWAANIFFGAVSLWLFRKVLRETPFGFADRAISRHPLLGKIVDRITGGGA